MMTQFVDRFVGRHEDPLQWQYRVWLNLTEKGKHVSADLVDDK
ncbi:hypothetical protein [Mycobacterium sp. 1245111.1]|nr:hypothetical protein [Mycobacterium sp. 1245111.1]